MDEIQNVIKEKFSGKIINFTEHSLRRYYVELDYKVIPEAAKFLFKDLGCRFVTASGLDTPKGIEILYHFSHDATGKMITVKTVIKAQGSPRIESITPIIKGAEWIEREMWEMLGIHFDNHPNLKKLLLADDWPEDIYPLRHDRGKEKK